MSRAKRVSVIGLGYVGLPTALILFSAGYEVHGSDMNQDVLRRLEARICDDDEPGLRDLLVRSSIGLHNTPQPADIYVIAVPTPLRETDKEADLSAVFAVCDQISPLLKSGDLVVLESTVPVGTTSDIRQKFTQARPDLDLLNSACPDVSIAYCPERVLPGRILEELINNDRVIGGITPVCAEKAAQMYRSFSKGNCHQTDARSAEMTKLAENAFRDVNIAFANELSLLADANGVDVWKVIELANCHPRVNILRPSTGVGGHCVAVDPWFLASPRDLSTLVSSARAVNERKPDWVADQIRRRLQNGSSRVACYGLTYKKDSGDMRQSPSIAVVERLVKTGVDVAGVVEPFLDELPPSLSSVSLLTPDQVHADLHVLLTPHKEFLDLDMTGKNIFDPTGHWV